MKAPRNNSPIPNQPFTSNDLPTLKGPYWDVALGSGLGLGSGGNAVTAQGGGGGGTLPAQFPPFDCSTDVDTANIVVFYRAWEGCSSLTSFPMLDTSSGTDFRSAWVGCTSLTSLPQLDVSQGTNFSGAWAGCTSLTSFPLLDVSQGTDFSSAWQNCTSLTFFPLLNVSQGTSFGIAWIGCTGLTSFPLLDVSSGINFDYAWYNCTSLTIFPAGMFDTCLATAFSDAWSDCALDQTSVNNILVSLDTAGQSNGTVSIDGGTSAAPSGVGATAKLSLEGKGWTVVTN